MSGLGDLSPIIKGASPVETVGCWCGPIAAPAAGIMGRATAITAGAVPIAGATSGTQSRCGTTGGRWSLHDRDREPTQRYAFWNLVEPGGIEPPTS